MAFNPLKVFSRQQPTQPSGIEPPSGGVADASHGATQRGETMLGDVATFRPEVDDEVVANMLNNKNPELTRYENMVQDGGSGPDVQLLDKSSPKLAEAVGSSDDGLGPDVPLAGKSTPVLFEAVAQPETTADGILLHVEQQPYHGGGEAAQDVVVTEAVAPAPQDVAGLTGFSNGAVKDIGEALDPTSPTEQPYWTQGADMAREDVITGLRERGLIDTSTGEIVWADEARSNFTGSDEELGALIAWLQKQNLVDTSSGSIVWTDRMQAPPVGQQMDKSSTKLAEVATGDVNGDGTDTVGESTLLDSPRPSSLLEFEEIVVTVADTAEPDFDGDADIDIPD